VVPRSKSPAEPSVTISPNKGGTEGLNCGDRGPKIPVAASLTPEGAPHHGAQYHVLSDAERLAIEGASPHRTPKPASGKPYVPVRRPEVEDKIRRYRAELEGKRAAMAQMTPETAEIFRDDLKRRIYAEPSRGR
jgi:hypothetical protein